MQFPQLPSTTIQCNISAASTGMASNSGLTGSSQLPIHPQLNNLDFECLYYKVTFHLVYIMNKEYNAGRI